MPSAKRLNLSRNAYWMVLGSGIFATTNLLMSVAIAKIYPAESETLVGLFQIIIRLANPILLFAILNADDVFVTRIEEHSNYKSFMGMRVASMLGAMALLMAWSAIQYQSAWMLLLITVYGVGVAFDNSNNLIQRWNQLARRQDRTGIALIIRGVGSAALFVAGLFVGRAVFPHSEQGAEKGLLLAMIGSTVVSMIMVFYWDPRQAKTSSRELGYKRILGIQFDFNDARRILKISGLSAISILLFNYAQSVPSFFLEHYRPAIELSLYTTFLFVLVGRLVATGMGSAMMPKMVDYRELNDRKRFYNVAWKGIKLVTLAGCVGSVIVYFTGDKVWPILFNKSFSGHWDDLYIISIAGIFQYIASIQMSILTAMKYLNYQLLWMIITMVTAIVSSAVLIPKFGIDGAAYCTLATSLVAAGSGVWFILHADSRMEWRTSLSPSPYAVVPDRIKTTADV